MDGVGDAVAGVNRRWLRFDDGRVLYGEQELYEEPSDSFMYTKTVPGRWRWWLDGEPITTAGAKQLVAEAAGAWMA